MLRKLYTVAAYTDGKLMKQLNTEVNKAHLNIQLVTQRDAD